jgi:hypothetical protein
MVKVLAQTQKYSHAVSTVPCDRYTAAENPQSVVHRTHSKHTFLPQPSARLPALPAAVHSPAAHAGGLPGGAGQSWPTPCCCALRRLQATVQVHVDVRTCAYEDRAPHLQCPSLAVCGIHAMPVNHQSGTFLLQYHAASTIDGISWNAASDKQMSKQTCLDCRAHFCWAQMWRRG